jgi:hypothetical protein
MPANPPNERFRKIVRGFYAWLGSLLFAGAGPIVAIKLVDTETLAGRIAGVTLGTVSWIPMAVVVAAIIRAGDEFERRIHLVALALSFGSALLLLTLLDWLVRARFMRAPPLIAVWLAIAVLWLIWLVVVKRHFAREP